MKNSQNTDKGMLRRLTSKRWLGVAAIWVVILGAVPAASADARPIALTESGLVIGFRTEGMNAFLGIPYAASPVGDLRWRPPKRYGAFPGVFLKRPNSEVSARKPEGAARIAYF